MATYVNDLRLTELATGEGSGTWGTTTNTSLELIGEALGYATQQAFGSDADATTTVADGASDPARAMYYKITSAASLTATRTLTIAPNTISRVMFIENATSGSQSIAISQGSGANVTIAAGKTAVVYLDGAGSTAAVVDAMAGVDPGVTDTLAEVLTAGNTTTTDQKIQFRDTGIYINSSADGQLDIVADTEIQIAATTVDLNGNLDVSGTTVSAGKITADAGIDIDNINIDGTTIALSSGDLTLDVAGDIILDADGGDVFFYDAGATFAQISKGGASDLIIGSTIADKDIFFTGIDGVSAITALTLDMSNAGAATFNGSVLVPNKIEHVGDADTYLQFSADDWRVVTGNLERFSVNNSAVVVNEESDDLDFRVESNSNTHMLFVDGGNNRLGINTSSPSFDVDIQGANPQVNIEATTDNWSALRITSGATQANYMFFFDDTAERARISVLNNEDMTFSTASTPVERLSLSATEAVFNDTGVDTDFRVESDSNANAFVLDGSNGNIGMGGASNVPLNIFRNGAGNTELLRLTNNNTNNHNFYVFVNDDDNMIRFGSTGDNGGNFGILESTNTTDSIILYTAGGATFNERGVDTDFRVESDTNANMLFVDAGNNRVGIGSATSIGGAQLNVLGAAGAFNQVSVGSNANNSVTIGNHTAGDVVSNLITSSSKFGGLIQGGDNGNLVLGVRDNDITDGVFVITGAGDQTTNDYSRLRLSITPTTFIVNETGVDADFRVESDGNANMLFVDASTNRVGVGLSNPDTTLEVRNPTQATDTVNTSLTQRWSRLQTAATKWGNSMDLLLGSYESGTINSRTRVDFKLADGATDDPDTTVMTLQANGRVGVGTNAPTELLEVFSETASTAIEVSAGKSSTTTGEAKLVLRSLHSASGTSYARSEIASLGTAGGDADLIFRTTSDVSGPQERLRITDSGSVIVNPDGNNSDFRVESDTNTHMLFVDASTDRVGIMESSPTHTVHQTSETGRRLGQVTEWSGTMFDITNNQARSVTLSGLNNFQAGMVEVWFSWRANGGSEPATSRALYAFYEGNNTVSDITEMEFSGKNIVSGDVVVTGGTDSLIITVTNTDWFGGGLTGTSGYYYVKAFGGAAASALSK